MEDALSPQTFTPSQPHYGKNIGPPLVGLIV
jgi:hypothetical protein